MPISNLSLKFHWEFISDFQNNDDISKDDDHISLTTLNNNEPTLDGKVTTNIKQTKYRKSLVLVLNDNYEAKCMGIYK
jgi:hypothetical protein